MFPPSWDPTTTSIKGRGGGAQQQDEEEPPEMPDSPPGKKRKQQPHQQQQACASFLGQTDAAAALSHQAMLPPRDEQSPPVPFQSGLQQTILRRLNSGEPPLGVAPPELGLDHILSRVPYKAMLENLFSNLDAVVQEVPILSKAYEETFMRQAMQGEQGCVMGDQCECLLIDRTAPFVGVELRLPGDPDKAPQMCVLCTRATTQKCFYDMCYLGKPVKGVIQRYGNIFAQPGEYAAECMLMCPRNLGFASMPVPSMSHQRNRYTVVCHGGIKHLKQHRVAHEDFHSPSSTGSTA